MTVEYRYKLERNSKKSHCPDSNCNKKTFVRYIDTHTGNYLPSQYGRCDREIKCSYHLNPYRDGYVKMISEQEYGKCQGNRKISQNNFRFKSFHKIETAYIPEEILSATLREYEQNIFIQNLLKRVPYPFKEKDIEKVIGQYYLGTICDGYRAGSITFPFIDRNKNIRAIQVKQFDQENHTIATDFLHSILEKQYQKKNEILPNWLEKYKSNDRIVSCLFGEHLLDKYTLNPIALVEAPKTAIYGTLYFGFPEQPDNLLWLAVYNLSSLTIEKCKVLQGRDVYLFPDLSKDGRAFQNWTNKTKQFSKLLPETQFIVSDLLETLAPQELKENGSDIADVLIKMDWREFRPKEVKLRQEFEQRISFPLTTIKSEKGENSESVKQTSFPHAKPVLKTKASKDLRTWEQEITELEGYFKTTTLPDYPIKINCYSTITNPVLFVESHLSTIKTNNGNRTFLPYLNRLQELKQYLITNFNTYEN